jgi:hypothetical protein
MLPELMNHIFSYCEGPTNKIIKQYIKYSLGFQIGVIGVLRINQHYGFKTFNKNRLSRAISCTCPVCKSILWPAEYKRNINYKGERMCSRQCLLEYEVALSLVHMY